VLKLPAPIPPEQLKRVLELAGYAIAMEDEWNWSMVKGSALPIIIPKDGEFVAVEVMVCALEQADLVIPGRYFPLRDEAARQLGLTPH
jgi:hypothetical protein